MIPLLVGVALAGTPLEEIAEEAAAQREEIQAVADDLEVLTAYLRDEGLVSAGLVPEGWKQPAYEVYEVELAGRPSMLPMTAFVEAAGKAELDPSLVASYVAWTAERVAPAPAEQATREAQLQAVQPAP